MYYTSSLQSLVWINLYKTYLKGIRNKIAQSRCLNHFTQIKKKCHYSGIFFTLAVPTGFEPAISALTGRHVEPSYTTGPADKSLP